MILTLGRGVLAQFCRLLSRPSDFPSLCFGSGASLNFLSLMALKSLSKVLSFQAKESPTAGILCPGASEEACGIGEQCWIVRQVLTYRSFCFLETVALEVDRFEVFPVGRWRGLVSKIQNHWGSSLCPLLPWGPGGWQILEWSWVITNSDVLCAGPLGWNSGNIFSWEIHFWSRPNICWRWERERRKGDVSMLTLLIEISRGGQRLTKFRTDSKHRTYNKSNIFLSKYQLSRSLPRLKTEFYSCSPAPTDKLVPTELFRIGRATNCDGTFSPL